MGFTPKESKSSFAEQWQNCMAGLCFYHTFTDIISQEPRTITLLKPIEFMKLAISEQILCFFFCLTIRKSQCKLLVYL